MSRGFADCQISWSVALKTKLATVRSTIGRSPFIAAPAAIPTEAASLSGRVRNPAGPEAAERSRGGAEDVRPQVLAHQDDALVALHLLRLSLVDRLQEAELRRL